MIWGLTGCGAAWESSVLLPWCIPCCVPVSPGGHRAAPHGARTPMRGLGSAGVSHRDAIDQNWVSWGSGVRHHGAFRSPHRPLLCGLCLVSPAVAQACPAGAGPSAGRVWAAERGSTLPLPPGV